MRPREDVEYTGALVCASVAHARATTYVSAHYYICVLTQLDMCPQTPIYVSQYSYICVLIRVLILLERRGSVQEMRMDLSEDDWRQRGPPPPKPPPPTVNSPRAAGAAAP